jgi:hypothetical protein
MDAVGALRLLEKGDGHRCPGNLLLVFVYVQSGLYSTLETQFTNKRRTWDRFWYIQ